VKAWQIASLGDPWDELNVVDVDSPPTDSETVRIRVEATDLNFADILQCQGSYQIKLAPPFTPGMNATGTVLDANPNLGFAIGERIVGPTVGPFGGYAEEAILLGERSHGVPDELDAVSAIGAHVTHGTAWFALHQRGKVKPGETVLVLAAAGGVGSAAVQMAGAFGCWVAAAAAGAQKTAFCQELGADLVVDYDSDDLYQRIMDATDGRGVDVVYDSVGKDTFLKSLDCLKPMGMLALFGQSSGAVEPFDLGLLSAKGSLFVTRPTLMNYVDKRSDLEDTAAELFEVIREGAVNADIRQERPLREASEAHSDLESRRTTGATLLIP